ncbi:MAG TPA: sigma-70 family RNA polymerase sigma factor [Usitatibacteraceae bacterium]|nr:sigma-70 family RNA polymerase sigma factor [Usitatibacteraceae bacterium]
MAPSAREAPGFTDNDLILRVLRDDDRHAFGELVRRHQSTLRASLRRMTQGNFALADDIAQETFILAWKNIRSFRFEAKFSTWLYRIAFNAWQSGARKRHEELSDDGLLDAPDDGHLPADAAAMRHDLMLAMQGLSEGERNAIFQCYYNDLSHEEAAWVLGIPLGTVKTHIMRAKDKMRERLAAYASGEGAAA